MPSSRSPNHLRSYRKRLALSQDEVAFLMGVRGGSKICRYERFVRGPSLETALAFEIIYGKPIGELFVGLRKEIAKGIDARARILRHRVSFRRADAPSEKRRAALNTVIITRANY